MENRKQLVEQYAKWILMHESNDYQISQNDSGNIELLTKTHIGRVNFYPEEIMELRIDRLENDATVFFLHFQMNTVEHAHVMFEELEKALISLSEDNHMDILLSCTGGLTTSYFAAALNETAEQMKLNYSFSAMSVENLKQDGVGYDAILLAPQIAFMRDEIQEALKGTTVINIPPTIFGGYDANKLIELVQNELEVKKEQETPNSIRMAQYFKTIEDILTFVCEDHKISYRYYEHGVVKDTKYKEIDGLTKDTVITTVEEALKDYPNTTILAFSFSEKVNHGVINGEDVKGVIKEKFGKKTVVYNDAHMCVTGLYWLSDHYKSLIYYKEKNSKSEAGIFINGHLVRGKGYYAGQTNTIDKVLNDTSEYHLAKTLTVMQATIGTEAFFVESDQVEDIEVVKKYMSEWVQEESMPEIILLDNSDEYLFTGLFLRSVWNKEHSQRRSNGLLKYKG